MKPMHPTRNPGETRGAAVLRLAAVAAATLLALCAARADEEAGEAEAPLSAAAYLGAPRYAVVIGIDDYADRGIGDLVDRESGARAVRDVLLDPQRGGLAEADVALLLGADATAAKIRKALDRLKGVEKEATVFVYFAGHGAAKGEDAWWVARDSKKSDLARTALAAAEVRGLLERIPAERILLMMDCRHAAGLYGDGGSRPDPKVVLARYHGPRHATLGAGEAVEHAVETEQGTRPIFTHHLVEGLSGVADEDENGVVDLDELVEHVGRRMRVEARQREGLERPVVDLEGVGEPSHFLLTIEPKGLRARLEEDEPAQAERRDHLHTLEALHADGSITTEQARLGRYLLGALPEAFEPHEWEQRTLLVDLAEGRLAPEHLADALTAVRRTDRRTLVVPDEFETIQAAVDAAAAGDTVLVRQGRYTEHVVLKTGICLRGEGRERTVLQMVPGKAEILLAPGCAWGSIEDLQVDGTGGKELDGWIPDGLHLRSSSLRITGCLLHSCLGCGLYASDPESRPYVRDCTVEKNAQDGICFRETGGGLIVECISRSNGAVGIQVRQSKGEVVVRDCLCEQDAHAGIAACGGSTATLVSNVCRDNEAHGILAWDEGTTLVLEGNTCSGNRILGIYLVQRATAEARGNECAKNREGGIVVAGLGTKAVLVDNRCADHDLFDEGEFAGIVFRDGASGEATSNTCESNTCGILVMSPGTSVRLRDNRCRGNKTGGITFSSSAPGQASGNQCEENGHGIAVSSTEVTLEDNTLARNKGHGILLGTRGTGRVEGNRCRENGEDGIHVTDMGTRADLLENTCAENGRDGIRFARGASGTADGNECSANEAFGISAYDSGTRPTFRRNRCTDNVGAGIGKEEGAAPVVESSNVLSGNGG